MKSYVDPKIYTAVFKIIKFVVWVQKDYAEWDYGDCKWKALLSFICAY